LENKTLQTLILACNQLDAIACITISAGVMENRGLRRVVLDGNPIGEQVGKKDVTSIVSCCCSYFIAVYVSSSVSSYDNAAGTWYGVH